MVAKVSGGGGGSCRGLAEYLEKEQQGQWFDQSRQDLSVRGVIEHLDANKRNLGREEAKFYQLVLSPSQSELKHLGNDPSQLQAYTRAVMEAYASHFGKGIESRDLVWYAKIEHTRHYNHQDRPVQLGEIARGQAKAGEQTHVHVLVSRTENLARYQAQKQSGAISRKNPLKLSPATNHRGTERGAVQGGFDRSAFKTLAEQVFDQQFGYSRALTETFAYANTMAHGEREQRVDLRHKVRREQERQQERQKIQERAQKVEPALKPTVEQAPTLAPAPKPVETARPVTPAQTEKQEQLRRLLELSQKPPEPRKKKGLGL
ncbi:hypothetical protein LX87_05530 [Larkinella arboricola]|uniref:Relaxase/mobilization nuclease-like protein n=1 Tax=Larkinella arboricola TaxID=643671 RepID=A0A327WGQ9_LARAB|nr:DUF5712 family protein [Larkinella arboricola]RAJ90051.1 hypothetical protein LX87_05530 [Larkinella arboricola]